MHVENRHFEDRPSAGVLAFVPAGVFRLGHAPRLSVFGY